MSHTVSVNLSVTNLEQLKAAAERVGAVYDGTVREVTLFDDHKATGVTVQLPGWRYPIVVQSDGSCHYDNYQEHWGSQALYDQLMQEYTCGVLTEQALLNGYTPVRQTADNGDIVLEMTQQVYA